MARSRTSGPARAYLSDVEGALWGIDADLRTEILQGLSEELDGLTPSEARLRISQMGSADSVALEAKLQIEHQHPGNANQASESPDAHSTIAALIVIFGGFLIPFIGFIVGYGMVWVSNAWSRRQKKIATLTLMASLVVAAAAVGIASTIELGSGWNATALIPPWFEAATYGMTFVLLVNAIVGVRLLSTRRTA